jgi:hypothetical protein
MVLAAAGAFALIGVLAFMYAGSMDWGPPGTLRYVEYERANRLVGLPWLATTVLLAVLLRWPPRLGVGVAFVGSSLILVGSVGEFWVLTDVSYRDPIRATAWTAFLLGHVVFLLGYLGAWVQARSVEPDSPTPPYS